MFYRQLAEISSYVNESTRGLPEILQMLCLKALYPLKADALIYSELDPSGYSVQQASFGMELKDNNGDIPRFHLSERTPFTDAIRESRVIIVNTLPLWPKPYSALKELGIPGTLKSLITSPVEVSGLPIGSLTTFSHAKLEPDEDLTEFIEALSMILAIGLKKEKSLPSLNGSTSNHSVVIQDVPLMTSEIDKTLSERQLLILKLIAEGRTNASIADVLGYSESLIRQETIKIYAKLNCSGRNEAAQAFHRLEETKESITA